MFYYFSLAAGGKILHYSSVYNKLASHNYNYNLDQKSKRKIVEKEQCFEGLLYSKNLKNHDFYYIYIEEEPMM